MKRYFFLLLLPVLMPVSVCARHKYQMADPYEVIARDGTYRHTKTGSERDMRAALDLAREGQPEEAAAIVDAYAETLQRLDGHDAPLCAIQCYDLVRAMTILHHLQLAERTAMIHRALVPMMEQFEADSPYANGNWTEPGQMGRGRLWDIYELPYRHYVKRMGLQMPYTERILKGKKPKVKEYEKLHQVFTYPAPDGAPLKHDYEVFVQPRGGKEWTRIDTYAAKVNALHPDGRKFTSARIRPDYRGVIANVMNDSTVQFLLFQPENVSVELDGNITDNLLLFTSKPPVTMEEAKKEAKRQGRKFAYFAPGFYTQDTIRVASNTMVYLAGGSYFTGTFAIEDAYDVSILGRGIARPGKGYEGCHIHRSSNVLVDGLTVNTCPIGESTDVTLHDVRSISHPAWGDGLNVFGGSSNILFDRVFCRNSDDCTTAYATRKGFSGNTRSVTMRNSTLWADVAHPIFIGIHGNAERGDNNLVRNVLFDNIRIEDILEGSILQVKVAFNQKYCAAPGRTISDDMPGKPGWHTTADYVPMFVGNHADNITFTR